MEDPSDIERARLGDPAAFERLVKERIGPMTRTAMAILGREDEARDAVQDALLAAWRDIASLRDPGAFDAWLTRILVNRCRRGIRRFARARVREIPADLVTERDTPADPDVASALLERRTLERAFERLSVDERSILVLHHLDGRSISSIAQVMAIPEGTAKSRLFSARRALERSLGREQAR